MHPEKGMINPFDFIPITEETGLIVPIGIWVLNEACKQLAQWSKAGLTELTMYVYLSAVKMREPTLTGLVKDTISIHGLEPHRVELELTESLLMD